MAKVLIVSEYPNESYHKPFNVLGECTINSDLLWTNPKSIRLVVFTGGADISPSLYGQEACFQTHTVPRRDIYETIAFRRALNLNLPMFGICRGAQLLNVMAGGSICQHLDYHTNKWHDITTSDDKQFIVSSAHHQMMLPPKGAIVLAWSTIKHSYRYLTSANKDLFPTPEKEYEVIHWPKIRAVGVQYHPEMMNESDRGFKYVHDLIGKYLL